MAKKLQSKEALARSVKKLAQKGLTAMEIGQELGYTNVRINQIARALPLTAGRRKQSGSLMSLRNEANELKPLKPDRRLSVSIAAAPISGNVPSSTPA